LNAERFLVTTADDYGIGEATSKGILELAATGSVKSSVLLVNSPFAQEAVEQWRRAGEPMELGWHPCLTLDRPVAPASLVPSLVQPDGTFWPLGRFLARLSFWLIRPKEIELELREQYRRFVDLVGHEPTVVNSHHHVQVFEPVGTLLVGILGEQRPAPYLRRIGERWSTLWHVPGAKIKRTLLRTLGARHTRAQRRAGFPGNDVLAGITDPPLVANPRFLEHWLENSPGRIVELTCHPGYFDPSLVGRDCTLHDGQLQRRVREFQLLRDDGFLQTCRRIGLSLMSASQVTESKRRLASHAA
jgi:predicted glycoside hydrolase/deacetylase ChbG (UPF0249 family)